MEGVEGDFDVLDLDKIEETATSNTQIFSNCLVGKLQSDKSVNSYAILEVMKKAWRAKKGLEAREWTHNLFLFRFEEYAEMAWVIKNQPWHFEGHLFTIRPLKEKEQPSSIQITEAQLWIRIYDAPVSCMTATHAKAMARKLGLLVAFDPSNDFFGKYMRIKIEVDITKPLKRGLAVVVGGVKLWLPIKYEGLPLFCYNCGMIGHTFKTCEELEHVEDQDIQDLPYGPSIKASPLKKNRPWSSRSEPPYSPHPASTHKSPNNNPSLPNSPNTSLASSNRGKNTNLSHQNPPSATCSKARQTLPPLCLQLSSEMPSHNPNTKNQGPGAPDCAMLTTNQTKKPEEQPLTLATTPAHPACVVG